MHYGLSQINQDESNVIYVIKFLSGNYPPQDAGAHPKGEECSIPKSKL
jgi:hypothetical protein